MKGRDFGLGLLVLAIVAATVTAVVVSGRDTSAPARAEDTTHELTTPVSPQGCGEVTAREPGETTVPSPASQWTFPHDAHVQVTAHAHEGCTFSKWVFDFAGYPVEQTTNPTQFQLIEDMTATAHFTGTPASPTPTPTATAVPPPVTASCKWSTLGENPVLNPGLKSDCETLLKETSTLAGTATLNWSVDTPMADWDGVGLDGTPRRVTSVVLKSKELTGSIPVSFGSLAKLDTLVLGQNQLTGAIPVELGNLTNLTQLHLEQNQLTGSIPAELGNLTGLTYLSLGLNQLTGTIPAELGNLTKLNHLWLKRNQLTGTIPPQLGNLTLLTHLVLDNNQLTGQIPTELGNLSKVTHVYLAGNTLTGCLPAVFEDVGTNDFETLGLAFCGPTLTYDTYDTTGAVATAGSYAFLTEGEDGGMTAVTTYEALRDGTTTMLRISAADAADVSQAAFYDTVEAADRFELREASDCWTRYHVTKVTASVGTYREFAVRPYAYAYEGCSGPIAADAARDYSWNPAPPWEPDFTTLIRFGPWILDPGDDDLNDATPVWDWSGEVVANPVPEPSAPGGRSTHGWHDHSGNEPVGDLAAVKRHPLWSEPDLPDDWRLYSALTGIEGQYAFCAWYAPQAGGYGVTVCIGYLDELPIHASVSSTPDEDTIGRTIYELRVVDGHPAGLVYSPPGTPYAASPYVEIYDEETGIRYSAYAYDAAIKRQGAEGVLAIARSLYLDGGEQEEEQMLARAFRFTYDTYDTTGAVTTAGSYSFMSEGDDGTTGTVTTYEGLRDGSTTALLIHKTDAEGTSRSDILDAVEAGDLVEWRKADDCFVRYKVLGVKPDPTGTIPKKALDVEWMTYAFTGCSGAISTDTEVGMTWGDMLDLGGVDLPAPVVHGPFQIVPAGWTGVVESGEVHELPEGAPEYPGPAVDTKSLAVARGFPYWREANATFARTFSNARTGGYDVSYGYCAIYVSADGYPAVRICGEHAWDSRWAEETSWVAKSAPDEVLQGVLETRMIRGRPALASYSPLGLGHSDSFTVSVRVYDEVTESMYELRGHHSSVSGSNVDAVIELARSLFVEAGQEEGQMLARAFLFTYDTYDTTGAVTTAGSYAFLTEGEDGAMTAVTTYEALRDGTTTMLKIHTADADDTSQADVYDEVEEGHLIEWSQAGDCFVRYRVSDAPALSEGAISREFGVRPETYAWQSCQTGSLPTSGSEGASGTAPTAITITVGTALPLEHLGGTNLTDFAVIHGPWQLTPYVQSQPGAVGSAPASVAVKAPQYHELGRQPDFANAVYPEALAEARELPYWREPEVPEGWTFWNARSGELGDPVWGYCAEWTDADGYPAMRICGSYADVRRNWHPASWLTNHTPPRRVVRELLVIADRPAWMSYSPLGAQHLSSGSVRVTVYDPATETVYSVQGWHPSMRGANIEPVIAVVRSLFEGTRPQ